MAECKVVEKPAGLHGDAYLEWLKPGWFVENPWSDKEIGAPFDVPGHWEFRCPVCEQHFSMDGKSVHTVVVRDPLTLSPSMACPSGCHYHVRNGQVVPA